MNPRLKLGLFLILVIVSTISWVWAYKEPASEFPWLVTALSGTFVLTHLGLKLFHFLFGYLQSTGAIARLLLLEAKRSQMVWIFQFFIASIPALTFFLEERSPLHYRLQIFLSFGLGILILGTGFLTIFLSSWSITRELQDKTLFSISVKPVSKSSYLMGKALGLLSLNALLIGLGGVYIGSVAMVHFPNKPSLDDQDKIKVQHEILTPREVISPEGIQDIYKLVDLEIDAILKENPNALIAEAEKELEESRRRPPGHLEGQELEAYLSELGSQRLHRLLRDRIRLRQRTLTPGEERHFTLKGLSQSADLWLLRYDVRLQQNSVNQEIPVEIKLGNRKARITMKPGKPRWMNLPNDGSDESGELKLSLLNLSQAGETLTLTPQRGLEILSPKGSFLSNLVKTLSIIWIKIAVLACIGLLAGTALSFPVASLATTVAWLVLTASPVVLSFSSAPNHDTHHHSHGHSHDEHDHHGHSHGPPRESLLKKSARALALGLQSYTSYDPVPKVVEGKFIETRSVTSAFLILGLLWCGVLSLIAIFIFKKRELAKVQV